MKICAAPHCDTPLTPNPRGRPAIYCSPACRPSGRRPAITVDITHPDISPDGRPAQRVWTVTLRRGSTTVVIATDLGWPSAIALATAMATALDDLLTPRRAHTSEGATPQPGDQTSS